MFKKSLYLALALLVSPQIIQATYSPYERCFDTCHGTLSKGVQILQGLRNIYHTDPAYGNVVKPTLHILITTGGQHHPSEISCEDYCHLVTKTPAHLPPLHSH